ncbi:hypothetical protein ABFS82_11G083500 [Erythranthe guttata]
MSLFFGCILSILEHGSTLLPLHRWLKKQPMIHLKITVVPLRHEDNATGILQQFDRVVGCRVHGDNADFSCNAVVNDDDPPFSRFISCRTSQHVNLMRKIWMCLM